MGTQLGQIKMASVSSKKLKKACGALAKYLSEVAEKDEGMEALIGAEETPVYVTVNMVHAPRAPRVNPYTIKIPHTMLDDDSDVYVIVKNPVSAYDEKIEDAAAELGVTSTIHVVDLEGLERVTYTFEAQRVLLASYDLFLGDKRILAMLGRKLGKKFFVKKKLPIGLELSGSRLKASLATALSSTQLYLRKGVTVSVPIGFASWSAEKLAANAEAVIDAASSYIVPGGWDNIRSIAVKGRNSIPLFVFKADLEKVVGSAPVLTKEEKLRIEATERATRPIKWIASIEEAVKAEKAEKAKAEKAKKAEKSTKEAKKSTKEAKTPKTEKKEAKTAKKAKKAKKEAKEAKKETKTAKKSKKEAKTAKKEAKAAKKEAKTAKKEKDSAKAVGKKTKTSKKKAVGKKTKASKKASKKEESNEEEDMDVEEKEEKKEVSPRRTRKRSR